MNWTHSLAAMLLLGFATGARTAPQQMPQLAPAVAFDRPISLARFVPDLASDQKRIWPFPARLVHRKVLLPTAAVLGVTAGLVALDPISARYFRNTSAFNGFNKVFPGNATMYATVAAPVVFYAAGLLRKDTKMQHTGLLAVEAVADTYFVTTVMKDVDRRLRPIDIPANGNFSHSWFDDNNRYGLSDGSFPSGHMIAAVAVATVVSRRYGNHRWVPYVAYGLAGLVGFSRLTLNSHFVSDVFMGGALGYSISRFVVLRQ